MDSYFKIPFYARFALISIGAFAFVCTMYFGQEIILPLIFATIIAILLNPFVNLLVRRNVNRLVAIAISVFIAILISVIILYILSVQLTLFGETYPKLKEKFIETTAQLIHWISVHFNIKTSKINSWIHSTQNDAIKNMGITIGETISAINHIVFITFLIPVYLILILYYKDLLIEFIRKLFKSSHHDTVFEVLINSKKVIQSYLNGLLLEASLVATLNSVGLLILGVDYAIILGITGALLNVIPYIGGVIAIALPMIIAFVTMESPTTAILVLGVYLIIQFIDNHFIIPHLVASKVKLNALISIIAILLGAELWGIPGMFLSIPLTAILKVIFDHIEPLKPWGYLLGNIVPTTKLKLEFIKKKIRK